MQGVEGLGGMAAPSRLVLNDGYNEVCVKWIQAEELADAEQFLAIGGPNGGALKPLMGSHGKDPAGIRRFHPAALLGVLPEVCGCWGPGGSRAC